MVTRVLLVSDGRSVHTARVANGLIETGVDVHIAAFDAPRDTPRAAVHLLPRGYVGDARYLFAVPRLRRIVRKVRPDVVHAHYLSSYGLMAALARPPQLVQTAWGSDVLVTAQRCVRGLLAGFALRRSLLATGDSQSILDELARLAPAVARHRFVFGPPRSLFAEGPGKQNIILSPRNHEPLYCIDIILDAWELARDHLPGYRLVVAGSGSGTAALRQRAGHGVHFAGSLPYTEMLDLVAKSKLVVSVPRTDGTSAAVLEALAARCSVVATDLPSNREWLPRAHLVPVDPRAERLAQALIASTDRPLNLSPVYSFESQIERLVDAITRQLAGPPADLANG